MPTSPVDRPLVGAQSRAEKIVESRRQKILHKTGALQEAICNSADFSSIAPDDHGVIQVFNVGAERMRGQHSSDVVDQIT
ncbi:PAS domain-containing sensor histidine kinase, partial [Pseudomonas syringae]